MGVSSPTTTTTTTESSEEGSGSGDSDGNGYWSIVYDAIVWIDAFTVSGLPSGPNTISNKLTKGTILDQTNGNRAWKPNESDHVLQTSTQYTNSCNQTKITPKYSLFEN